MLGKQLGKFCAVAMASTYAIGSQASAKCSDYQEYHPDMPTTGLYWFTDDETKVRNDSNPGLNFFDPSKPTVIFVHGRQANQYPNNKYERFDYKNHDCENAFEDENGNLDLELDLVEIWRDKTKNFSQKSWNVGAYYWGEEASKEPVAIEKAIWINGRPTAQGFYEDYKSAMTGYTGPEIRLVGHSMGNELVMATSELIMDDKALRNPDRVALLDPFYSNAWSSNGQTPGEMAVAVGGNLTSKNIALEFYRSSLTSAAGQIAGILPGDDSSMLKLRMMSAHADLKPLYIDDINPVVNIGNKHIAIPYLYFQSMAYEPADEVTTGGWSCRWIFCVWDASKRNDSDIHALSASTPNWRVSQMMGGAYFWEQVSGEDDSDTQGDQFKKIRRWW